MAFMALTDLIAMTINELSQVPGVVTQKYSVPIITQYLQNAFLMEIEDQWWPDYMTMLDAQISGTTGLLTSDLVGPISPITEYGDIAIVWVANSNQQLLSTRFSVNPTTITASGPVTPVFMVPDFTLPNRPFKVYPPTGIGPLKVWARQRHTIPFAQNTRVGIDPLLLMYDAAWMYCVNDGTLPAQVAKYELLIRKRRQQATSRWNNQPIPLDSRTPVDDQGYFVPAGP